MSESDDDSQAVKPVDEPVDESVVDESAVPATPETETPADDIPAETLDGADAVEEEEAGEPPTEVERVQKIRARVNASKTKNKTSSLQQDQKLKQLLEFADEIQSVQHFTYWKDHFLATFSEYLDADGTATAREADDDLYFWMQKLALTTVGTQTLCQNGGISGIEAGVHGQKSISEMTTQMARCKFVRYNCSFVPNDHFICSCYHFCLLTFDACCRKLFSSRRKANQDLLPHNHTRGTAGGLFQVGTCRSLGQRWVPSL